MVSSIGLYVTAFLACYTPLFSSAIPLHRVRDTRTYIVKLKSGIAPGSHLSSSSFAQYNERVYDSRVLNGYAIGLTPDAMEVLKAKYAEQIEYVEEDQTVYSTSAIIQNDATWGLQRISHNATLPQGSSATSLNYTYRYDSSGGEGVDIYVFDTGVYIEHEEFGGRATHAPVFIDNSAPGDRYGHGTHCAGTAAGTRYGVAKKANIIDVKVLSDNGSGSVSAIIAGLSWAVANAKSTNRPGVISMSLGGFGPSTGAQADAVRQTVASGLAVVVAAGNEASSATEWTPANVDEAIVVGNLDISDGQYRSSNYGPTLDVFAPGVNVVSAGITGPSATKVDTGTSMSAPHVAGIVAYLLSLEGPRTPAELSARIVELATPSVLSGLSPNTTNLVAQLPV
ncbi:Subtilisin-like protease 8 OS=Trichophyton verrucosum (strain HKI 0517) GN=SUB8 PE=3 SV=1 [Rhizoctonia solani AG-1 IB]|uniref:Subtilisin-like protease 8 n=1 Tax=Thanatephorus cucumeris (strain AG1-IB / isolate 7/3/14) TaxID=1108050 RepID=A0A0B7FK62_THACB|nr:Subtilisin-like protease 8 OS=Trichophyton verrucosum (strain HKI 0517) GN=SUB8 PE=3 SV=1 [Rhizoctonia solani AG-1 IB]